MESQKLRKETEKSYANWKMNYEKRVVCPIQSSESEFGKLSPKNAFLPLACPRWGKPAMMVVRN